MREIGPLVSSCGSFAQRGFSLFTQNTAWCPTLRVHRIIQAVLIDALPRRQQRQWAGQALRLVNYVFPEVGFDTQKECERYLPQAQHCATLITAFQLTLKEGALLLQRLGSYCYQKACYNEAETYLTQALQLQEQHHWATPQEIAQTLNALGLLYRRQARYPKAEKMLLRALELREQTPGPTHPQMAESLHNLAVLYTSLGQYQQAEHFYQRVLTLDEETIGSEHPETAKTLNNLGLIYTLQGDDVQAEAAYQRALAIYEHVLSPNDPDRAYPLNGLGALAEKHRAHRPPGVSELTNLRLSNLDRKKGVVTVLGKGSKERRIAIGNNCLRNVLYYLDRYRPREEELDEWGSAGEDHLFLAETRTPLTKNGVGMLFKRVRERAGIIDRRLSPHILRHTFAIRYLISGGDPFSLQELLGHEDMETVKLYMMQEA